MNPNKLPKKNIKAKIKFYLWLVSIGADLKDFDPANLQIEEIPGPRKSSFKNKASEIKEKHNYKFANLRQEKPIINISNKELIFEPKK
jgi:hypothetical protein